MLANGFYTSSANTFTKDANNNNNYKIFNRSISGQLKQFRNCYFEVGLIGGAHSHWPNAMRSTERQSSFKSTHVTHQRQSTLHNCEIYMYMYMYMSERELHEGKKNNSVVHMYQRVV